MAFNTLNVVIAAVAVIVIALLAFKIAGKLVDNTDEDHSETDEIRGESETGGDFSVPVLKKHKQLSWPLKAAFSLLAVLALAVGVYAFMAIQQGAPIQIPYGTELLVGGLVFVGVFVGVGAANTRTAKRGEFTVIYEDDSGDPRNAETIYFNKDTVSTDQSGRPVIREQFDTRILGLFSRLKLVGHDPDLRSERAALGDPVRHRIPEHAIQTGPNSWEVRTKEQVTNADESKPHYDYKPSSQIPQVEARQLREEKKKMEMEMESYKAELAEAETHLQRLQRRLETRDQYDREAVREEFKEFMEAMPHQNASYTITKSDGANRRPRSQREAAEEAPTQD